MNAAVFCLVCWGLTNILVTSTVAAPARDLLRKVPFVGPIVDCMMCAGFWVGVAVSAVFGGPVYGLGNGFLWRALGAVADGFLSSGVCWLAFMFCVMADRVGHSE